MLAAVVSDTHGQTQAAEKILSRYRLNALFFLGDYYPDGKILREACQPKVPLFSVAGNGDIGLSGRKCFDKLVEFQGQSFFLTHGHKYQVKKRLDKITAKGEEAGVDIVLFGHTHIPFIGKNEQGMWLVNPGSASFPRGIDDASFALLEWEKGGKINPMIMDIKTGELLYSGLDL